MGGTFVRPETIDMLELDVLPPTEPEAGWCFRRGTRVAA
jgi:hypothetical protein